MAALLYNAMGNTELAAIEVEKFVSALHGSTKKLDLVSGRSSSLVAGALLIDALGADASRWQGLRNFGDQELADIWSELSIQTLQQSQLGYWGIAHGWAGILFATARWCEATGQPMPDVAMERLKQLASSAQVSGEEQSWVGPKDPALPGSWCHGTAGYTNLWATSSRVTGDSAYDALCLGAAEHCWHSPSLNENLCCGAAGQSYAMLVAYQVSGDEKWLERAEVLAQRSLQWVSTYWSHTNALYKGDVGIALLAEELRSPNLATMPLFGPEKWQGLT